MLSWLCLVFLAAFVPYCLTLHPTFHTFDVAEFAAGAYELGIVHSPGYPAYLLAAHLVQAAVPVGDPAYRLNLLSAASAALTVALLACLAHSITGSRSAATVAALLFAFSYRQWSEATIATPYTLNTAVLALELVLLLRWRQDRKLWRLYAAAGLYGVQLGLHTSAALEAAGLALLVLTACPQVLCQWRVLLGGASMVLLGLSLYLYLPLRYLAQPRLDYARMLGLDLTNPSDLWAMVSGHSFSYLMFAYSPAEIPGEAGQFVMWLWENFFGVGAVFGVVGLIRLFRRDRGVATGLIAIFALHVAFFVNYRVPNKSTMFLPAYMIWSAWTAVAIAWLEPLWVRWLEGFSDWRHTAQRDVRIGLVVLASVPLVINFPRVDSSQDYTARAYAEEVLGQLPPEAFVLGTWLDVTPLHYAQIVEGKRPDVSVYDIGLYGLGRASRMRREGIVDGATIAEQIEAEVIGLVQGELEQHRVYTLGQSSVLAEHFNLRQCGRLHEVLTQTSPEECLA